MNAGKYGPCSTSPISHPSPHHHMAEHSRNAKPAATVSGENWEGRDISAAIYTSVAFADLDLTEVTNTGAVFTDCTFRGARFNVSVHTDAAFVNCTFANCTFFDTQFTDCKFVGSTFERCTYDLMRVTGGNWSFAGLRAADLRTATFSGTRLREADLSAARCEGSSLRDVDLAAPVVHPSKQVLQNPMGAHRTKAGGGFARL